MPSPKDSAGATTYPLPARQFEVASLVARGLSNKEIASTLGISVRTVEHTIQVAFYKLGVSSRYELMARYLSGALRLTLSPPRREAAAPGATVGGDDFGGQTMRGEDAERDESKSGRG